jgi:hypothetical protein
MACNTGRNRLHIRKVLSGRQPIIPKTSSQASPQQAMSGSKRAAKACIPFFSRFHEQRRFPKAAWPCPVQPKNSRQLGVDRRNTVHADFRDAERKE